MSEVIELAYVVYEAPDLSAWRHFAVDLLGMQPVPGEAAGLRLRTDSKAYRWLVQEGSADDLFASGYLVRDSAALDRLADRLRAAGVEIVDGGTELARERQVERILLAADPMGNRVELVTGFADAPEPFHSDVLIGGFVTGDGGAGHQVLLSKGVSRSDYLAFYQDLLGFRISDVIVEELAPGIVADLIFLHCNPRHHTVAFGEMPHPKRTHHFMLEVNDIRDVGAAYDRCLRAGQPFEMTLGMHPNDHMFSFYVQTPAGFSVEYGWGGLLIDDATWEVRTLDRLHWWGHMPSEELAGLLAATTESAITQSEES